MRNVNFNFLNFCTIYKSKGSVNKELHKEYCFNKIFYQGPNKQKNTYVLEIYVDKTNDNDDNNCFLTTEQLEEHINTIKKVKNFKHTLEQEENKYILTFTLDAPRVYHKIILSWLRYTYEFPFNMAIYDAFKLKDVYGFKRVSLFNLFNLIGGSLNYYKHGCDIHGIGRFDRFQELVTWNELNDKIKKHYEIDPKCAINDIVNLIDRDAHKFKHIKPGKGFKVNNSNFWETETEFQKRTKVYRYNLRILKNIK